MKLLFSLFTFSLILTGCAGIEMTPISTQSAEELHNGNISNKNGYIVYQPMVVVEVRQDTICLKPGLKGKCAMPLIVQCTAGKPFTMPNYSKPYLVNVKSGFGKAGVELDIENGWMLGKVVDKSDNSQVLGSLQSILPRMFTASNNIDAGTSDSDFQPTCHAAGLYKVNIANGQPKLERLLIY